MYAQPTQQNLPGYGAAQSPIASIVQDTVMRLKDLDVRLEVVNQELAQLCDTVGAPQVAQLARTPVQAFLPGTGAHPSNIPQLGAAFNPGTASAHSPWAANQSSFAASPFAGSPYASVGNFATSPYLGAAYDPSSRWNASAINAFGPASFTADPYAAWNTAQNATAFASPYAAVNPTIAAQNVAGYAPPYAAATPNFGAVQTPFTAGFIR